MSKYSVTTGVQPSPVKTVLYGPEGIGKSTFASHFPEPVFIDTEGGTKRLNVARLPQPTSWAMLLDKLEQMDMTTLNEFARWLEAEGLQAIATRVSTGSDCQIIIEDGMVKGAEPPAEQPQPAKSWTKGAF